MLLVAVASLVESRGRDPVFYHQVRVGQNGKLFRLHKFRSMRVDAEADGVARCAGALVGGEDAFGQLVEHGDVDDQRVAAGTEIGRASCRVRV